MKLSQILNEGLVKVPESTLSSALEFVVSIYFSLLKATYEENDQRPPLEFKRALKRATDRYGDVGLINMSTSSGQEAKIPYPVRELPKKYRKGLSRDFKIKIWAGTTTATSDVAFYTAKKKGRPGYVAINIGSLLNLEDAIKDPSYIDSQLHELAATVEHELMHATQDIALRGVDGTLFKIDYYKDDGTTDIRKHSLDSTEYSPNIRTAAGEFKHIVSSINDGEVLRQHVVDFLHAFVNPTLDSPFHDGPHPNKFFEVLYNEDRPKWKKAAKYLHGLLRDYIDRFSRRSL